MYYIGDKVLLINTWETKFNHTCRYLNVTEVRDNGIVHAYKKKIIDSLNLCIILRNNQHPLLDSMSSSGVSPRLVKRPHN